MKISCGILPYRIVNNKLEIFLVKPGGPFWKNKNFGAWSIAKGEHETMDENYLTTALREFKEECGILIDSHENLIYLDSIQQNPNKKVLCWAVYYKNNINVKSNFIEIEWPSKSKKTIMIPEIDTGQFFTIKEANEKIISKQQTFILRLIGFLKADGQL